MCRPLFGGSSPLLRWVFVLLALVAACWDGGGFYRVAKLGAMVFLLLSVLADPRFCQRPARQRFLAVAGWAASIMGDAFLAWSGFFVPGLASFLTAHLLYIALFRSDARWLASRHANLALCLFACGMGWLLSHAVPPPLRVPVCAYIAVIAVMTMQVLGRAQERGTRASWVSGSGALLFLTSDTLLAINKFLIPLPASGLLVLSTYYAAQACLLGGWLTDTGETKKSLVE